MKITFVQKQLNSKFTDNELLKISKERSDFILFPARVLLDFHHSPQESVNRYDSILDQWMDVSEKHKGVLIAGTMYRKLANGSIIESVPIIQDLNFIDHYDLQKPNAPITQTSESETVFIMAGVRFGLLAGKDYEDQTILESLQKKGIQTVFILDGLVNTRSYEEDLEYFFQMAQDYDFNIFRICGYDTKKKILGRSLVATPSGIQWKVGKMEEDKDIIKTIHFAQANPFL